MAGGPLVCGYGCLGYGDCERSCAFDAIAVGPDGLPVVDLLKCTRCGACLKACPRGIIAYLPQKAEVAVLCCSKDRGPAVRKACSVGCIACKACEKVCEPGAIVVTDNLAVIDYAKCTSCGKCIEKCPTKCIVRIAGTQPPVSPAS
jgi:ferredoxin